MSSCSVKYRQANRLCPRRNKKEKRNTGKRRRIFSEQSNSRPHKKSVQTNKINFRLHPQLLHCSSSNFFGFLSEKFLKLRKLERDKHFGQQVEFFYLCKIRGD